MPFPHSCYSSGSLENSYWANKDAYLAKMADEAKLAKQAEAEKLTLANHAHVLDAYRCALKKEAASLEDLARLMTSGNGARKADKRKKSTGLGAGAHYSKS